MNPKQKAISFAARFMLATIFSFLLSTSTAQMREAYADFTNTNNDIKKLSFYSGSSGYIASTSKTGPWVGFTSDSGKTFTKKLITNGNVNFGLNPANLLFGFSILGVKSFNQNTLLVYGDFGDEPSILYSSDGGNSYTLVFWSSYAGTANTITDIIFPENNTIGYAIDNNRILKTNNQGISWSVIATFPGNFFTNLEAVDNNNVFVLSTGTAGNGLMKTTNGGSSWQNVSLPAQPAGIMQYAHFLTAATGWLDMSDHNLNDNDNKYYFYKTTDGGANWSLLNHPQINSFYCFKMKFTDVNTGYALSSNTTVYKTLNSGINWEPLPRDNNNNPGHNDLQCISSSQLWAGGNRDFLEISTNGGGMPTPESYFKADTSGLAATGNVSLINYSRTDYTYKWFLNRALISTTYNTTYVHDFNRTSDSILLIVSNGVATDTSIQYVDFFPRVRVTSFLPLSAPSGTIVNITGTNFLGANAVSFGGTPAAGFTVVSATNINATVSSGASGYVKVVTATGTDSLAGFTYILPPVISSFAPAASTAGSTVIITGSNFTGTTAVFFDSIPAISFTVVSATTITAVTPSGESGSIKIIAPGGTTIQAGYIALPTITSFSPVTGTQGSTLNITGTSLTGVTAVTAGGINVLSFTVNSSVSITARTGAGATGNIIVSKQGGSSSLAGYTWFASPIITSFSPAAGPVGTTVIISGTGFNAIAANNIVYFGAVKGTVVAGSATSLTVTVPTGATFYPISVLNNNTNLSAYSARPFLVTYAGGNLSGYTYGTRTTIHPSNMPMFVSLGDLDADGKTDLIVSAITDAGNDGELLIYRNTSTIGASSFESPVSFEHVGFRGAIAADLDGDGKPDLAVLSSDPIATFLNTSSPGNISFATGTVLPGSGGFNQNSMVLGDADGDGKPDIVTSNGLMFRNTSTPGNISFDKAVTVFGVSRNVVLTDLNGDNKPDLVFSDMDGGFYVLKNICTKGTLAFEAPINFTGFSHAFMTTGDIDSDGKTDLISADYTNGKLGVIRNTGTGGNFSFDTAVELPADTLPFGISISDIDGDGKPDIAMTPANYVLAAYRNTSTAGVVSFLPVTNFISGTFYGNHIVALGDIDGDGKNDAVTSTSNFEGLVSVHLNTFSTAPSIQSFTPLSGKAGDTITITGTNFTGVTAVSFGNTAASFIVESPTTIEAIVGLGTSGNVTVTTGAGNISLPGFTYLASVFSFTPATGIAGTVVTIKGDGFIGATGVSFGGASAISFTVVSNSTITAVIGTGATGKVSVTDSAGIALSANDFTFITSLAAVITDITPISADKGATVTISGANFNNSITGNAVYFGTIKAVVVSVTSNTLTVIVPDAAMYEHVLVTANDLTAISAKPFVTTFAGSRNFTAGSFAARKEVDAGNSIQVTGNIRFDDMNGDNKLDIVIPTESGFNIIKNTNSSNGLISFAPVQYFISPSTYQFFDGNFAIADFDGDGKPDIVQMDMLSQLGIRRNISTSSDINFDTAVLIPARPLPLSSSTHCIAVTDFNHDGKPDIAAIGGQGSTVSIFINTSVGASLTFDSPIDIFISPASKEVKVEDIDNDQRPDIIVTGSNVNGDSITVFILRNTSSGADVSFAPAVSFKTISADHLLIGDLDGDLKPDIVINDYLGVSILRNISKDSTILFAPRVNLKLPYSNFYSIGLNDLNGDGKPDIFGTQSDVDSVTVFQNQSTPGNLDFTSKYLYGVGRSSDGLMSGDLNGDGKPDIAVVQHGSTDDLHQDPLSVLTNQTGTAVEEVCSGSNATLRSSVTGTSYQWQQNAGNGFSNISDNSTVTGTNAAILQFTNIPVFYNGYQYLCIADGIASDIISLAVDSSAGKSAVNISTASDTVCAGMSVIFTAVPVNAGTSPSYQWLVNGINAGTNSAIFTVSTLATGSNVKVILTSSSTSACMASSAITDTSNTILITERITVPAITISGTTDVKKDSAVLILSSTINGGSDPLYQWQDSTSAQGWNNINGATGTNIMYAATSTGNKIRCVITSNADCSSPTTVNSNTLAFTVNTITATGTVPGRGSGIRYYPNPVSSALTIDSLQLTDQWQTLDIITTNGKNNLLSLNVRNQVKLVIPVQQLAHGFYIAILRRKKGNPVYLKFIKM